MTTILDEKMISVILVLIDNKGVKVPTISRMIGKSERYVYYAMTDINDLLLQNGLEEVHSVYGEGYVINKEQEIYLRNLLENNYVFNVMGLNSKERQSFIYILILFSDNNLFMKDLELILDYSRFTIQTDINKLKLFLENFNLKLISSVKSGYIVQGKENDKRKAYFHLFSDIYKLFESNQIFLKIINIDPKELNILSNTIFDYEKKYNIQYIKSSVMSIIVLIMKLRYIKSKRKLEYTKNNFNTEKKVLRDLKVLDDDEVEYFSSLLYFSRIGNYAKVTDKDRWLAQSFIDIVYSISGLLVDDVDFKERLSQHLAISRKRYKYNIIADNPLIEEIKIEYKEYFNIVKEASRILSYGLDGYISENEIGYITLYFAGYHIKKRDYSKRFSILLVCVNGTSTSYILKKELENLDDRIDIISYSSLESYKNNSTKDYDLIISTVDLESKSSKCLVVNPILSTENKRMIRLKLNELSNFSKNVSLNQVIKIVEGYVDESKIDELIDKLSKLYKPKRLKEKYQYNIKDILHVEIIDKLDTWEETLCKSAQMLLIKNYIKDTYINQLIDNINTYGPYMIYSNSYLLGHTSIENSKKFGISFSILKESIFIHSKKVDVIINLSYTSNEEHLVLLKRLYDLFLDDSLKKRIMNEDDLEEVFNIVSNALAR